MKMMMKCIKLIGHEAEVESITIYYLIIFSLNSSSTYFFSVTAYIILFMVDSLTQAELVANELRDKISFGFCPR